MKVLVHKQEYCRKTDGCIPLQILQCLHSFHLELFHLGLLLLLLPSVLTLFHLPLLFWVFNLPVL